MNVGKDEWLRGVAGNIGRLRASESRHLMFAGLQAARAREHGLAVGRLLAAIPDGDLAAVAGAAGIGKNAAMEYVRASVEADGIAVDDVEQGDKESSGSGGTMIDMTLETYPYYSPPDETESKRLGPLFTTLISSP
jgi:hypothetical protein